MHALPADSLADPAATPGSGVAAATDVGVGVASVAIVAGTCRGTGKSIGPGPGASAAGAPGWLQRHRLVWLHPAAWDRLLGALRSPGDAPAQGLPAGPCAGDLALPDPWDVSVAWPEAVDAGDVAAVRDCLAAWAAHGWPLVATRQDAAAPGRIALGLPAPARWGRRRIALRTGAGAIARWGDFGGPESVAALLPAAAQADWARLGAGLRALGVAAGVYGSHGWQALTGQDYLHAGSDLDLLLTVADAEQADRVAELLHAASQAGGLPRLDGELAWPDGAAVAWREWRRWRAGGMAGAALVKRLHGAALEGRGDWPAAGGAA